VKNIKFFFSKAKGKHYVNETQLIFDANENIYYLPKACAHAFRKCSGISPLATRES
jgi:hypothetical protein